MQRQLLLLHTSSFPSIPGRHISSSSSSSSSESSSPSSVSSSSSSSLLSPSSSLTSCKCKKKKKSNSFRKLLRSRVLRLTAKDKYNSVSHLFVTSFLFLSLLRLFAVIKKLGFGISGLTLGGQRGARRTCVSFGLPSLVFSVGAAGPSTVCWCRLEQIMNETIFTRGFCNQSKWCLHQSVSSLSHTWTTAFTTSSWFATGPQLWPTAGSFTFLELPIALLLQLSVHTLLLLLLPFFYFVLGGIWLRAGRFLSSWTKNRDRAELVGGSSDQLWVTSH